MPEIHSLRIIAGSVKNKLLISLPGLATRPLLGRIKKSLFDILNPKIVNALFLDLYAGTGNVGIEALSRGAKEATFIDYSRQCLEIIKENLINCGLIEKAEVLFANISVNLPVFKKKFDIIFIGPPYKMNLITKTINMIEEKDMLSNSGWLIAQHHVKEDVSQEIAGFTMFRQKKYGYTLLSFFKKRGEN